MSGVGIVLAVVIAIALLTIVCVPVRLLWRLRREQVEPAGRDSDVLRRNRAAVDGPR